MRYYRLKTLQEEMRLAQADGSYPKLLEQVNNMGLLLLDDWGMETLDAAERSNLLEIVDTRYGMVSTIIASQLPVESGTE